MKANQETGEYEGLAPANSRQARMLQRKAIDRLWESKPLRDSQLVGARRVGHMCICDVCGMFYTDHPSETREKGLDSSSQSYLTRMCDGVTLFKL